MTREDLNIHHSNARTLHHTPWGPVLQYLIKFSPTALSHAYKLSLLQGPTIK